MNTLYNGLYVPLNITVYSDSMIRLPPQDNQRRAYLRELIKLSVSEWNIYYKSTTIALIVICFIFMVIWMKAKFRLFYRISLMKYFKNEEKHEDELSMTMKIKIGLYTIYNKNHINSLIYMFIIGLVAVTTDLDVIYSFILLAMANLDETLKNIINAIILKYKQLFLTILLSFIIVWSNSTIGFFFFNSHFDSIFEGVNIINIGTI